MPDAAVLTSDLSDLRELPFDAEVAIDEIEYFHLMRRIGLADGEEGTTVSAFNSSI